MKLNFIGWGLFFIGGMAIGCYANRKYVAYKAKKEASTEKSSSGGVEVKPQTQNEKQEQAVGCFVCDKLKKEKQQQK